MNHRTHPLSGVYRRASRGQPRACSKLLGLAIRLFDLRIAGRLRLASVFLLVAIIAPPASLAGEPISPLPLKVDVNQAKARLGKMLFQDKRLSADDSISCASCHELSAAWGTDLRPSRPVSTASLAPVIRPPYTTRYSTSPSFGMAVPKAWPTRRAVRSRIRLKWACRAGKKRLRNCNRTPSISKHLNPFTGAR